MMFAVFLLLELEASHGNYKCPSVCTFVCGISGIIANFKININDPESVRKPVRPIIVVYIYFFTSS